MNTPSRSEWLSPKKVPGTSRGAWHLLGGQLLGGFSVVLIGIALYLIFFYAPTESTMGEVQRIFYFHVASAWTGFVAFFMNFLGSVGCLWKNGDRRWDLWSASSAEIGVVFTSVVLVTGPLWAKPVWGIWWTWDARLTSTLVLWVLYVSYLILRRYVSGERLRAKLSAVVGITAFVNVPIVYMSVRWWRTQHPAPVIAGSEASGISPPMLFTLLFTFATLVCLYSYLMREKIALETLRDQLEVSKQGGPEA